MLLLRASLVVLAGTALAWLAGGWLGGVAARLLPAATPDAALPISRSPVADEADADIAGDDELSRLLEHAELAMTAGQLFVPPERSARRYFEAALERAPANAAAAAGLDRLATVVLEDARTVLSRGRVDAALSRLATARELSPAHRGIVAVEQALRAHQAQRVTSALLRIQAGDFDAAAAQLAEAETVPPPIGDAGAVESAWVALERGRADARARAASRPPAAAETVSPSPPIAAQAAQAERAVAEAARREGALARRIDALVERTRAALEAGRLLTPEWENAKQHLAELSLLDVDAVTLATLRSAYLNRLLDRVGELIAAGDLDAAQAWLDEARLTGQGGQRVDGVAERLALARLDAERNRIARLDEFEFTRYAAPRYPRVARQRGDEGWVEVQFRVREDGSIDELEIVDASQTSNFRDAAVAAVRQWRFEPKTFQGQPISQRVRTRLAFRLGDE